MHIYPVIHYLTREIALQQVALARGCGADGVFLISHDGADVDLVTVAARAKRDHPDFQIGINLLSEPPLHACERAKSSGLDMVWADDMGVDSSGANAMAHSLSDFARDWPEIVLFASVAFKYRPHEPDPARAARMAQSLGFLPTTSGAATGSPPDVEKIATMSAATGGRLAIASGMTPENVGRYASHLSHILVATGIGADGYHIDPQLLRRFIANAGVTGGADAADS